MLAIQTLTKHADQNRKIYGQKRHQAEFSYSQRTNLNNWTNWERRLWTSLLGKMAWAIGGSQEVYQEKRIQKQARGALYRRSPSDQQAPSSFDRAVHGYVYWWQWVQHGDWVFVRRQSFWLPTQEKRETFIKASPWNHDGRSVRNVLLTWKKCSSLWSQKL